MDILFLVIVGLPLLVFGAALYATALGVRRTPRLDRLTIDDRVTWPRVSIVVPACNEALGVEGALRSLLEQRYPSLQVVAVDDRSSDGTGAIMDRLAAADERLAVVHIDALPEGWLGKLNALAKGVASCDGTWLLFADADAHIGPDTLKKCISYADRHGIDFISVMPKIGSAGFFGDIVFNAVISTFCLLALPWRIRDAKTKTICATGAFMLVRRTAFDRTPGFEWLKLEVADDFGLCLMIKTYGGRCDMLAAREDVKIAWYASLRDMNVKLQKNCFAVVGRFSLPRMVGQSVMLVWFGLFPFAALLPVTPGLRFIAALALAVQLMATLAGSRWGARPTVPALLPGVGYCLLAYMMLRAGFVGWRKGGIEWRGVLYPTAILKNRQRVKV